MSNENTCTAGVAQDFLLAYLDHELSETQEVALESHLAVCPPCRVLTRRLRAAGDLVEHAIVVAQGQAAQHSLLANALAAESASVGPELKERFRQWGQRLAGAGQAVMASLWKASAVDLAGVRQGLEQWGSLWPLELALPTLGPKGRGGSRRTAGTASPGEVKASWLSEHSVEVEVLGLPDTSKRPMVLLIPVRRDAQLRRRSVLTPDPKHPGRWVARFDQVGAGSYLVAMEPLAGS